MVHQTIFDPQRDRTDSSPAAHDEPTAEFYDRCANPVIGAVRENLETWYREFRAPKRHRHDLRARLRDPDRRLWNSAAWELYVHAALVRMCTAPQPGSIPNSTRVIDYITSVGDRVYVECAVLGHPDEHAVRQSGVAALYAAIDRIDCRDYWLDVQIDHLGPEPIPPEPFVQRLTAWLRAQDPDALAALATRGLRALPAFEWDEGGSRAHVIAIARSIELRGRSDLRPIGIMGDGGEPEGPLWMRLLARLESKADIYGELDAPYVIALNAPDAWPDSREAEWAVFGPHPFTDAWERSGFFLRDAGSTRSNVSGVLMATALQPHSFTRQTPTLYENPHATRPVPASLTWRRVRAVGDKRVEVAGVEPTTLFGLPLDWPGVPWP